MDGRSVYALGENVGGKRVVRDKLGRYAAERTTICVRRSRFAVRGPESVVAEGGDRFIGFVEFGGAQRRPWCVVHGPWSEVGGEPVTGSGR